MKDEPLNISNNVNITDPAAQVEEGDRYYNGEGVEKDFTQAAAWYEKAAKQGYAEGQYFLGYCYYEGEGVEKDFTQAAAWYLKAAEQGHAKAQQKLAVCYYSGDGVEQDFAQAFYWCKKSAEQGRVFAQYMLGILYYNGQGVEQDFKQAVFWCEKAAEQGDMDAQYSLGDCYLNAEGVEEDREKAVFWYTKAAEQGHVDSCVELAEIYLKGGDSDFEKGIFWFREAAKTGEPKAMLQFGKWLLGEEDYKSIDKDEGLQWLEKAADKDEHDDAEVIWEARWVLAEIYEYGLYNIAKDIKKAAGYYKLLVEDGDESAVVYLKLLSQGKEDPVYSRGWSVKHLVARTLINDFPEFDAVGSLYIREDNYEDVEFTGEDTEACLPVAERIMELAALAKSESILAFAAEAEKEKDIYFKTALKMAADGMRADLFDEVIKILFVKEKPAGAQLLRRFIIHRGVYLIIRGDFSLQRLRVLLGSLYVPRLLLPKTEDRKYKITFNYLLTHRELPRLYFEGLNEFYKKILPDPEMMQRFLFFAYNRSKYFATENPDIEPAFEIEKFDMYMYGSGGRNVLIITLPKCDSPPDSYQIAIPAARQKAGYYTCELSVNPLTSEPCFIFGEWNAEQKHTNYGKIEMTSENSFAEMAVEIAFGKPFKELPFDRSNMEFETPSLELFCEKCETTNFFYNDNEPPYICDCCGAELEEE